jgi:hypothetical protein
MSLASITNPLEYYASHGPLTDPQEWKWLFDDLPGEVPDLCKVIHGLMIHPIEAHLYGVKFSPDQLKDQGIHSVAQRLTHIHLLDERSLTVTRSLAKRIAAQCDRFATLCCSMLRHRGVPARVRGGFAVYLASPTLYYNHWICEYWNAAEQGWVLVDPQLDEVQCTAHEYTFDPCNIPRTQFLTVDYVWQQCRAGRADPQHYGFDQMRGMEYIGGQLVLNLAALNKVELPPWGWQAIAEDGWHRTEKGLTLLDRIAALALAGNDRFFELHALYEELRSHPENKLNEFLSSIIK